MSPAPRVAVLSSAVGGGAGIAAARLAAALNAHGPLAADFIDIAGLGERLPDRVAPPDSLSNRIVSDTHFTLEHPGFRRDWLVGLLAGYDLINVHWASYLVALAELEALAAAGRPMLFWLHDFHYITGGCHYPAGCERFLRDCRGCPQIDIARAPATAPARSLAIKRAIFAHPNVHLAAPSRFLRDRAVAAGIVPPGRAHVLRNPYAPLAGTAPRHATGRVLLIADSLAEGRKNMALALEVLGRAARALPPGRVVADIVGAAPEALRARLAAERVPHVLHGRIADHARLTALLAEADVVLSCSDEDNWPNVLVEAGCHGVLPVVGPGHGCAEFVATYGFGEVAAGYGAEDFARALRQGLARAEADPQARHAAALRIRAEHAPERIAAGFAALHAAMMPMAA